jgi:hypothetical protein
MGNAFHPVRVARDAFAMRFAGSRRDLEQVTDGRLQAALLFMFLATRCVHLGQAGIDLAVGRAAYPREDLAVSLVVACVAESMVFAAVTFRARRLTLGALLGDASFGIVGLAVMSAATTNAPGRAGSLNWMLPYTVTTAVGVGLLFAADPTGNVTGKATGGMARGGPGTGGTSFRVLPRVAVVGALAVAYIASVNLPQRFAGDRPAELWTNDANYGAFFGSALLFALLLRRWLSVISRRNAEATQQAAQLSHEANWRAMTADLFGPVLEMLDNLAVIEDEVPLSLRAEAGRLIALIEATNPLTRVSVTGAQSAMGVPDVAG